MLCPLLAPARYLSWTNVNELIEALQFVHDAGYFHRDVRPQNVMMTHFSRVYLVDFGFAISQKDPTIVYAGTMSTASDRILRLLQDNKPVPFAKEDDVESLVKTVFLFKADHFPNLPAKTNHNLCGELLRYWEALLENWKPALKSHLLGRCQSCPEEPDSLS